MDFQAADRLPCIEWAIRWDKTIERWHGEGMSLDLNDTYDIDAYFGLDPYKQFWFPLRVREVPPPKGFVPGRTYGIGELGWVETAEDYEAFRPFLFPPIEGFLKQMRPWAERQARGEVVVWITLSGFFWHPRTLFGITPHMLAFYDQPELMHRMNQDLADYFLLILRALKGVCVPTFMTFAEDFSYNHGPMLSHAMFDEFMAPYYAQVIPLVRELNIVPFIDCDGDVTAAIPWLASVGVDGFVPLERQAGVDGMAIRLAFPRERIMGLYDKMTMNRGEEAMRQEFERLLPLMRMGGFIPSVDHQTPPGVSLEQYRSYLVLLREYMAKGAPH